MGLAGGAIGLGLGSQARATPAGTLAPGDDGTQDSQPFYGLHQSGVTTPQPAAALIASFDVLAEDRAGLERLFRTLTERIAFLMKGGEAATLDPRYPPPDYGLLGPRVFPDNLTVTVALGASLFDERYGLQKLKPTRLIAMEQFPNDALDAHHLPRRRRPAILLEHRRNEHPRFARHPQAYARSSCAALEDRRLPASPHDQEARQGDGPQPARIQGRHRQSRRQRRRADERRSSGRSRTRASPPWTSGGTYQVVRVIRIFVERWDRDALIDQQQIIGREKAGGAPLTYANEHDIA